MKGTGHRHFCHIWVDIYEVNVYWARCSRDMYEVLVKEEFSREAPKIGRPRDARMEVYEMKGRGVIVIWLSPEAKIWHVAHECFHAANGILEDRGLRLTDSSDEAYAYLLQYLIRKMEGVS